MTPVDEQRLRERLTGLANEIPPVGSAPPGLIPKARRCAYVMPALALLCVIAAAVVTFAGVRAVLGAQASVPAVPRPHPGAPSEDHVFVVFDLSGGCLLYTSPSPRDGLLSRMPSSA